MAASIAMLQMNYLLTLSGRTSNSFVMNDLMRLPLGILTGVGFIGGGAKDKDFLDEAEKGRFEINPVSGERLEALVNEIYQTPPRCGEESCCDSCDIAVRLPLWVNLGLSAMSASLPLFSQ